LGSMCLKSAFNSQRSNTAATKMGVDRCYVDAHLFI